MSVVISGVEKGSYAHKARIKKGDVLLSINGEIITDVLDYRFYQNGERLLLEISGANGRVRKVKIKKPEFDEIGLVFDTYLMDEKRPCKNKCIFCFIDQLPKGLRETLYFKDDDSRLSFLFGNYITLTNITEHEVERIIKMHISPVNISVHTTNPELRVKMMTNKNAGAVLSIIDRFNDAGIAMNCQLVLCPGYNDGAELEKSLADLTSRENIKCIASVPVGLTDHREGLTPLKPFDRETAGAVIDIIDRFGDICFEKYGERRVYAADEFYLLAKRGIPDAEYYGEFLQLENGVGLWALLKSEAESALKEIPSNCVCNRHISVATGVAAYPLISDIARRCCEKAEGLSVDVYAIRNDFFGNKITVSGLVTATDIIKQIGGKDLGSALLIPKTMLRSEGDMFLDSITVDELIKEIGTDVLPVDNDGYELVHSFIGLSDY